MEELNMDDIIIKKPTDHYTDKQKKTVTRNLKDWYNGSYESLNNYIQCGRWHARCGETDLKYKLLFGYAAPPVKQFDSNYKCICGQNIVELCFVCPQNNLSLSQSIVVGNECIDKFSISTGKCCEICGTRHFNRSFNLCNDHIKIKMRISRRYIRLIEKCLNCMQNTLYHHMYIKQHAYIINGHCSYKNINSEDKVLLNNQLLQESMTENTCVTLKKCYLKHSLDIYGTNNSCIACYVI